METSLKAVKGTKDLIGADYTKHQQIITIAEKIATTYGCVGLATPILEHAAVFHRTLGNASEIVNKEMYSLLDRNNDQLTLRPEFTAGVMRAVITNNLWQNLPLRLFSHGPLFRYERPQAGRQRQFHQINIEFLGENNPSSDVECIALATNLLSHYGIADYTTLELNSLGCAESRQKYTEALYNYFHKYEEVLSEFSKLRLQKNPLRILDSKEPEDRKLFAKAPLISNYYTTEAQLYFEKILSYLKNLGISYHLNPRLVRGLDYYCHTTFEFTTDKLGAQAALIAGGRYNNLAQTLNNKVSIPAIGFGAGIERIAALTTIDLPINQPTVILPIGEQAETIALQLCQVLRAQGVTTLLLNEGRVGKRISYADRIDARYAVFIGEEELKNQLYKLRDLSSGQEQDLLFNDLCNLLQKNYATR